MQRYYEYRPRYNPEKKRNLKKGRIVHKTTKTPPQNDLNNMLFSNLTQENPMMSLLLKSMMTGSMDTTSIMRMLLAQNGLKF